MLRTAIRSLFARKLRLVTTGIAVLLGVAFMAGTLVLTDTVGRTFDNLFADVNAGTDAYVRNDQAVITEHVTQRGRVSADVLSTVRQTPGVAAAEGTIQGYTQLIDKKGKALGNPDMGAPTLGGNWRSTTALNPFRLAEGRAPTAADEVVIDRGSAKLGKFAVGDTVAALTPAGPRSLHVVGIATFGTADSPAGASYVLFTTAQAQELLAAPGSFDGIAVVGDTGLGQAALRDRLAGVVPAGSEVLTGKQLTTENQQDVKDDLRFFNTFLLTFAIVALFVGSFIIYNTFSIIVAQRTRENALLRAVGASRRQVLGSVLLEAAVVGLLASAAGLVGGIGVAAGLKALLGAMGVDIPAGGVVVSASTIVISLVIGVAVSLASAVLPARRAGRVPPVAALRDVAIDRSSSSTGRVLAGLGVVGLGTAGLAAGLFGGGDGAVGKVGLGAAAIFLGVAVLGPVLARPLSRLIGSPLPVLRGMRGSLARENAMRNPKRTSATASALMIGVGLVGFITVFAASTKASIDHLIDSSMRGDFIVDAGSMGGNGVDTGLAGRLAALPEVKVASPVSTVAAEVDGAGRTIVAVDPATIGKVFDANVTAGSLTALDDHGVAVLETTAEDHGWHVGDHVTIAFPATGPSTFTIDALYKEEQVGGQYMISRSTAAANVPGMTDSMIFVSKADAASLASTRTALEQATADHPTADVQDPGEFKAAQAAQIDQMLNLIYALLALAVVIALIGIANTLALSIHERRRELGLLRAVGMTRSQVRSTVRWESVIIALLGTTLGLVVGLFFGWALVHALVDQGVDRLRVPAGQLGAVTIVGAVAGVLAAVLPARRAARLDVLDAISAS